MTDRRRCKGINRPKGSTERPVKLLTGRFMFKAGQAGIRRFVRCAGVEELMPCHPLSRGHAPWRWGIEERLSGLSLGAGIVAPTNPAERRRYPTSPMAFGRVIVIVYMHLQSQSGIHRCLISAHAYPVCHQRCFKSTKQQTTPAPGHVCSILPVSPLPRGPSSDDLTRPPLPSQAYRPSLPYPSDD